MSDPIAKLLEHKIDSTQYPLSEKIIPMLITPVGISSSGYPFLQQHCFEKLRDTVGLLFSQGLDLLHTVNKITDTIDDLPHSSLMPVDQKNALHACQVIHSILNTAAITAPTDLWLLRHMGQQLADLGAMKQLLLGHKLHPETFQPHNHTRLQSAELAIDLRFLQARGYLTTQNNLDFSASDHPVTREYFRQVQNYPPLSLDIDSAVWTQLFTDQPLMQFTQEDLLIWCTPTPINTQPTRQSWIATWQEIELGARLLPIVLGLKFSGLAQQWLRAPTNIITSLKHIDTILKSSIINLLTRCGLINSQAGSDPALTGLGTRVLQRAAGPFGIIAAYQPYLRDLHTIWKKGRGHTHLHRQSNLQASKVANQHSFSLANDALDRLCRDTGLTYTTYIEHAMGQGEATRQRHQRSGSTLTYVGADLEQASIDSALKAQAAGQLPANMLLLGGIDIGKPKVLLAKLKEHQIDSHGAIMIVGNGFHEIRDQTDATMVEIFSIYQQAGIILMFTEQSALQIDDMLKTAWNTYHAGFKYVHQRSGQGLRPAYQRPLAHPSEPQQPMSWDECIRRAGYIRGSKYCQHSRTIFPFEPQDGHNPAISVTHVVIPAVIAQALGLATAQST